MKKYIQEINNGIYIYHYDEYIGLWKIYLSYGKTNQKAPAEYFHSKEALLLDYPDLDFDHIV